MSKKIVKEIAKLYQLPLYVDQDEFMDKVNSYLYARFQFEDISLLTDTDLPFDPRGAKDIVYVADNGRILSEQKIDNFKDVEQVYILLKIFNQGDRYLGIRLGKNRPYFKKLKKFQVFADLFKQFWQRHLEFFSVISSHEKSAPKSSSATVHSEPVSNEFLSVNVKLMPDVLNMEKTVEKLEKEMIKEMLRRIGGVKTTAAKQLGITERMIGYKMKKYKL